MDYIRPDSPSLRFGLTQVSENRRLEKPGFCITLPGLEQRRPRLDFKRAALLESSHSAPNPKRPALRARLFGRMRLSVFWMKRGLHAPQLGYFPHDPLDQAVIEIGQLNNELLEPLYLPVEDRATIAHRLQLPWRNDFS